ncbi:MAG TPA: glucose 1-dehydrogenase [Sandaracinaceae bacterium LLY-WYZ-13_1]|nr:glucose 1-dehydrogenase [Sandaracinaceae bacterium LLY-WYZ-13_1]
MSEPHIHLNDKVAIVTGASRGIGAEIAKTFARAGAKVVLASRKIEGLQAVAEEIAAEGGEAMPHACHTGKEDQVRSLVDAAVEKYGQVDVLVNNAATNPYFGPMMNVEWGAWDKTFEVNVKGYFSATREVVRHIQGREGQGSIINMASVAGFMAMPLQAVYAMTKASVISMTKTLSVELGPDVRVNAIAPGLIETRFASALTSNDEILQTVMDRTSLRRVGEPKDVAGAALLLASDAGAYFQGAVLTVDGGWSVG